MNWKLISFAVVTYIHLFNFLRLVTNFDHTILNVGLKPIPDKTFKLHITVCETALMAIDYLPIL